MNRIQCSTDGAPVPRAAIWRHRLFGAAGALALAFPIIALGSPLDVPNSFADEEVISADAFNDNFDAIADAVNDNDVRITALEAGQMGATIVPPNAVMFFNLTDCPAGWEPMEGMEGRVPVGLHPGGVVADTIGTALDDEGTVTITDVPSHNHGATGLTAGTNSPSHSHTIANASGTHNHEVEGDGTHDHEIRVNVAGAFSTTSVSGVSSAGVTTDTFSPIQGGGDHTHTIAANEGNHGHTTDSPTHSHTVTIAGNTANNADGVESIDVTMPYMQLLACQKT